MPFYHIGFVVHKKLGIYANAVLKQFYPIAEKQGYGSRYEQGNIVFAKITETF
jgi:hypothetical protein